MFSEGLGFEHLSKNFGQQNTPNRLESSRPGPSSLTASSSAAAGVGDGSSAASDSCSSLNPCNSAVRKRSIGINGKGGSSSSSSTKDTSRTTTATTTSSKIEESGLGAEDGRRLDNKTSNNAPTPIHHNGEELNGNNCNRGISGANLSDNNIIVRRSDREWVIPGKPGEFARKQEESEDPGSDKRYKVRVFVLEDKFPWNLIRKERCSSFGYSRTRFPEPSVLSPGDLDNWPMKMARPATPITAFFKNRSVFVTGATGFLGKAAVEKLLRTSPDVQTVYVLIRPKSGSDVQARLEELLDNSLYDTLRQDDPDVLKKIVPISGDITLPYLGISEEDQETLATEVSVVIHSAATVKFDEKLKLSVNVNVQGTKRIVELCKRMHKLAALVHVSTAYANCERDEIEEKVYPPPADPNKLIQCMEWMDDDIVETITPQLIGSKPNTYTYTKALAEHILTVEAQGLPVCIVRPSIVTATWKEPVAGWVDNVNGPTGLIAACGKGVLRTLLCYRNKVADLIPLDFPVNLILSAAWYTAEHKPEGIKVYNCCTGTQNPLLWGELESWGFKHLVNNPLSDVLWYPAGSFKSNRLWNNINDFFIHYVPAYLMDVVASLTGRKPVMLKVYKKITKALQSLQYFTINEWHFNTDNMVALYEFLSPEDQRMFSFNVREVNWPTYIGKYCLGLRKYVMKEDHSTLPAARKHVRKLYWVHKFTQFFLILIFWRAIMFRCETARQLWSFMFGMVLRMARMLPIGEAI